MLRIAILVPGSVSFSPDDLARIARVRIAERLHVVPAEVDRMSYYDVLDCLTVWGADDRGNKPVNG